MTLSQALAALDGKAELTADDALALRQVIFASDQAVGAREAEALFTLNANAGAVSQAWHDLFIEAITDFVVRQQTPVGYVDEARAEWLIGQVRARRRVRADVVEMLIHVLETADKTPAALDAFALGMVKAQLIAKAGRGKPIVRADVERVRRALYATGGESNIAVSRKEAEVLFDLNDALKGADVDPAWGDLFMRAVGNAVLYESTWAPDAAAELEREAWEKDTSIHPLKRMGVFKDLRATFGAMRGALSGGDDEQAPDDAYEADQARQARAEVVTADEAHWLVGLIGRSGGVDANEQALVRFIHENARSGDAALDGLLQALGPAPARPAGDGAEPRATFGLKAAG
jgi:hypothetical protein